MVGKDKSNRSIYEYHLVNKHIIQPEPIKFEPKPDYAQFKVSKTNQVVLSYGKAVVEIKGDTDFIVEIIKKLA